MRIPTEVIRAQLERELTLKTQELISQGMVPRLLAIVLDETPAQKSYIAIKRRLAESLGVGFVYWKYEGALEEKSFIQDLETKISFVEPTGIIIQQPLPSTFSQERIYASIPPLLEIEGHFPSSPFTFPLVQATYIGLDYVYCFLHQNKQEVRAPFFLADDVISWLRSLNIVIAGNGITTGSQIARAFEKLEIPFAQTASKSACPDELYKHADILISGVGKTILHKDNLKNEVILLNFGLHRDSQGVLVGDYDEAVASEVASFYTQTPGGLGPIDVLCMYGNLIHATARKQID